MIGLTIFCFLLVDFLFLSELFCPLSPQQCLFTLIAAVLHSQQQLNLVCSLSSSKKTSSVAMPQIHQCQKLTLFRSLGASPTGCLLQSDATTSQSGSLPQRSLYCGAFPPRFTVSKLFPLFLQPCGWHCFLFPPPRYFRVLLVLSLT